MAALDATLPEVYPEDREHVENLAKLQNMHNQVHNLRGLLPGRLLRPTQAALQNPNRSSPAKLAAELRDTAVQGSKDIRRFASDFRSEPMQQLWQRTSSSEFPQGRDAWNVDYEKLQKSSHSNNLPVAPLSATTESADQTENAGDIIADFKTNYPSFKVVGPQSSANFPLEISIETPGNTLRFRVTQEDADGRRVYHVTEQPSHPSNISKSIAKIISHEEPRSDLKVLLSMLASYQNLKVDACHQCNALFDRDLMLPKVRRRKPAANKDDTSVEWYALHESCVT